MEAGEKEPAVENVVVLQGEFSHLITEAAGRRPDEALVAEAVCLPRLSLFHFLLFSGHHVCLLPFTLSFFFSLYSHFLWH